MSQTPSSKLTCKDVLSQQRKHAIKVKRPYETALVTVPQPPRPPAGAELGWFAAQSSAFIELGVNASG